MQFDFLLSHYSLIFLALLFCYNNFMKILGIESSCDETAAAVVADGRHLLSSVVHSQIDIHAQYGGVVPEVAARSHIEMITPVIDRALAEAACSWDEIDGIAVTYAPAGGVAAGWDAGGANAGNCAQEAALRNSSCGGARLCQLCGGGRPAKARAYSSAPCCAAELPYAGAYRLWWA